MAGTADKQPPTSWWEAWPGLYEQEIDAFAAYQVTPRVLVQKRGVLILEATWPLPGREPLRLRIGFSPFHPSARPAVSAPDTEFGRHQDPIGRGLCLIPNESGRWNPRQLVADFVDERVKQIIATIEARSAGDWDRAAELEEHVPDPLMPYYAAAAEEHSVLLYNGDSAIPNGNCGIARLRVRPRPHPEKQEALEATLTRLEVHGAPVRAPDFRLPIEVREGIRVTGRWVRMRPPPTRDPVELLRAAEKAIKAAAVLEPGLRHLVKRETKDPASFTIIVFEDEKGYPGSPTGFGCIGLITRRTNTGSKWLEKTNVVRAEPISDEIFARVPVAKSIRTKHVILVGCGAIGAFVALELARAGIGSLSMWDSDIVRPGNSVRWPLGRTTWGLSKPGALAGFVAANYPWTDPRAITGTIGGTSSDPKDLEGSEQNQFVVVREAIREADLLIDATGSTEAQQALSHVASELGVPYIMGYSTLGAAGGVVASFPATAQACSVCMHEHWHDGSLPALRVDESGTVAPGGCNSITFTGGSFDLQEVSLQIVREAIDALSATPDQPMPASAAILELQDESGRRILPRWTRHEVLPHSRCCAA